MKMAHAPPGHHSVMGRPSQGGLVFPEYVVYRGEQAYPEYLITYQIVRPQQETGQLGESGEERWLEAITEGAVAARLRQLCCCQRPRLCDVLSWNTPPPPPPPPPPPLPPPFRVYPQVRFRSSESQCLFVGQSRKLHDSRLPRELREKGTDFCIREWA